MRTLRPISPTRKPYPWESAPAAEYSVLDRNGRTWATYSFRAMADDVAARCNADATDGVAKFAPYTVAVIL